MKKGRFHISKWEIMKKMIENLTAINAITPKN
jgi:hypothetical protein